MTNRGLLLSTCGFAGTNGQDYFHGKKKKAIGAIEGVRRFSPDGPLDRTMPPGRRGGGGDRIRTLCEPFDGFGQKPIVPASIRAARPVGRGHVGLSKLLHRLAGGRGCSLRRNRPLAVCGAG